MVLVTFYDGNDLKLGLKDGDGVLDVAAVAAAHDLPVARSIQEFLAKGSDALPALRRLAGDRDRFGEFERREADLKLGPPVPGTGKILCVGLNYRRHAAESGMKEPAEPVLFSKFANSVAAPNAEVPVAGLEQVDYEAELAFVIGRRGKNISEGDALSHVLGYLNANDLSERRLQMISGQWLLGKTLDRFLPLGPYLLTADQVPDPQSLPIRGWLNGELRQDSNTSDMIFTVAEIISYASRYMTLEPGDLICTGTPEGVVLGREDKQWMKAGDEYTVEIGPLGRLSNTLSG